MRTRQLRFDARAGCRQDFRKADQVFRWDDGAVCSSFDWRQLRTATLFFPKLQEVIAQSVNVEAPEFLGGEVEIDESYFGGPRQEQTGRRWRQGPRLRIAQARRQGAYVIASNAGSKTIFPIIRARMRPNAVVYSDGFQAYDVLDVSSSATCACEWCFNYRPADRRSQPRKPGSTKLALPLSRP